MVQRRQRPAHRIHRGRASFLINAQGGRIQKQRGARPPSKYRRTGLIGEGGSLVRSVPLKTPSPDRRGLRRISSHSAKASEGLAARRLPAAHIPPRLVQQSGVGSYLLGNKRMQGKAALVKEVMVAIVGRLRFGLRRSRGVRPFAGMRPATHSTNRRAVWIASCACSTVTWEPGPVR